MPAPRAPHAVRSAAPVDLMTEYAASRAVGLELKVNSVTNKLYADSLDTGQCIPGPGRKIQLTMTARF